MEWARGVRHGTSRRTRFQNPLDFRLDFCSSRGFLDFWISKWIWSVNFSAILLSGLRPNLKPENWVWNFNFYIHKKQKSRKLFIIRLFSLLKAQKSNPGHNFRLLASLKGKSQNSFFRFRISRCSMWGTQTTPSGCNFNSNSNSFKAVSIDTDFRWQ